MVALLKMPGGIFVISIIGLWLFIFVESRISGHKPSYGHYIKYGLFIGFMNAVIFYVSHGEMPKISLPIGGGGPVASLPEMF